LERLGQRKERKGDLDLVLALDLEEPLRFSDETLPRLDAAGTTTREGILKAHANNVS